MKNFFLAFALLTMSFQSGYAQITPGIYKQVQYKVGEKPLEECPFHVYKISNGQEIWQIDVLNYNPFFYMLRPLGLTDLKEHTDSTFTNLWVCDMDNHTLIRRDEKVLEYYSKNFTYLPQMYDMVELLGMKKLKGKHKLVGTWKSIHEGVEVYVVYSENAKVTLQVTRDEQKKISEIRGDVLQVRYHSDAKITEGDNDCGVYFYGKGKFVRTHGNLFWERCQLPTEIQSLFAK